MYLAAIIFFAVPLLLLVLGAVILVPAVRSLQRGSGSRGSAVIRLVTGAGLVGWALLAVGGLLVEMQYAIVILPMLAIVGAVVWTSVLLGVAALLELRARRHPIEERTAVDPGAGRA